MGGDIYTAYTFVAVPATLYAGSAVGFFAVPYTIIVYPLIFLFLTRLWSVSHVHGYVTPADFVRGRYGSPTLALVIAVIASIEGFAVQGSAESLGRHVTASVVKSIFMVIVLDGIFAVFFAAIDF